MMLIGCDPVTKYKVLSFFFDGVPLPPGMAPDPNAPLTRGQRVRPTTQPAGTAQKPKKIYLHKPYAQRQCTGCHSRATSFQVPVAQDACRKCHPRYYDVPWDDWIHGPVAVSKCSLCHLSHESEYRGLLKEPQTELCFSCHDRPRTLSRPYHVEAEAGVKRCGACHDPHSAGNRLLLIDSTTYLRRTPTARELPTPHGKWKKDTCNTCHLAGKSNELIAFDKVNQACVKCHEKVRQADDPKRLHEPVRKGQCISCHQAHKSPLPHMIRPDAERNCLSCHKPKEIENDRHPPVRRVECLLCHAGHTSPLPHLLKPPAPPGKPQTQPAGAEADADADADTGEQP